MDIEQDPSRGFPVSRPIPEDRRIRPDHTQSCARERRQFLLSLGLYIFGFSSFGKGISNPTHDSSVPAAISKYDVMPHPSSAQLACSTSTEPAVASPGHKRVFVALSASSVSGMLLHYHLRRSSPVPAYCLVDIYSTTQRFALTSVSSFVSPPRTREVLWYLQVRDILLLAVSSMPFTNYLHPYPNPSHHSYG